MLRTVKPRNARSKRAMDQKAGKIIENTKKVLFVPGSTSNKFLHDVMVDLDALKKPYTVRFSKKNEIRPFEDSSSLEFFSEKNDCSIICLSTHSKKRPNCLTFARTFNYQIYDMIELMILNGKLIDDFRKQTFHVGMRPLLVFNGSVFDEDPLYMHVKSLFLDIFKGQESQYLDPAGLQHIITITAPSSTDIVKPKVHFRVYLLKTEKSTTPKKPRVELEEIGPRLDFTVGRQQLPNPDMEKQAFKRAKQVEKTKKNVEMDMMGDKLGRIHVGKQDLNQLQTRKMKGLKRKYDQDGSSDEESIDQESIDQESGSDDDIDGSGDDFAEFSD